MAEIPWEDDYDALPPKLQHFGKIFYPRFMHPTLSSLHEAQKEALKNLLAWFKNEHTQYTDTKDSTAVVVMPTGTGKTGVICCLPYAMGTLSPDYINIRKPILIIAPGIDILCQLKENLSGSSTMKSFLVERGFLQKKDIEKQTNYSVRTVESTMDVHHLDKDEVDIILSNSQKWRKKRSEEYANYENLPDDLFSMVIVDEAHHLPAKQWSEIVNKFQPHAKIVFFTATPIRADKREITQDLTLSTKGYTYKLTREEAVEQNLIRNVEMNEIPSTNGIQPRKKIKLEPEHYETRKEEEVQERMYCATMVLAKVKQHMEEKNRKHPLPGNQTHAAIIIAKNIHEANIVKDKCVELGYAKNTVRVVHTAKIKTSAKRIAVIRKIKAGSIQVVIVVKMLLEGFDYPPFSIAGIVTNIQSPVKFAQFVGRIQRLVRHTDEDGNMTIERGVTGDIITHEYFEQKQLFEEFIQPLILEEENEEIDENNQNDEEENEEDEFNGCQIKKEKEELEA